MRIQSLLTMVKSWGSAAEDVSDDLSGAETYTQLLQPSSHKGVNQALITSAARKRKDTREHAAGSAGKKAKAAPECAEDAAAVDCAAPGPKSIRDKELTPPTSSSSTDLSLETGLRTESEQSENDENDVACFHHRQQHSDASGSRGHQQQQQQQATPSGSEDDEEEEFIDFDPYAFIKSLPALEACVPRHRQTLLPRQTRRTKRKTLVLDLDETLVHSSLESVAGPDFTFPVEFNNQEHTVHVRQRPHLMTFMERVSQLFEVVIFTASQKVYAEKLLNILDPEKRFFKHKIYRESCVIVDGNYLKDLSILGRDMSHTLIVDNSPQAFGFQIDNGVPIESWYDDARDAELLKLLPFLESLVDVADVRPHIQARYRMREMVERAPVLQ